MKIAFMFYMFHIKTSLSVIWYIRSGKYNTMTLTDRAFFELLSRKSQVKKNDRRDLTSKVWSPLKLELKTM